MSGLSPNQSLQLADIYGAMKQQPDSQYVGVIKLLLQHELDQYGLTPEDGDIAYIPGTNTIVWKQKRKSRRPSKKQMDRFDIYKTLMDDSLKRETLRAAAPEIFQAVVDFIQLAEELVSGVTVTLKIDLVTP